MRSDSAVVICPTETTYLRILQHAQLIVKGRSVFCEPFLSGKQLESKNIDLQNRRIFVSNLPLAFEDQDVARLFSQFGPIQTAYRIWGPNGQKQPFGFVSFFSRTSANRAIYRRKISFGNTLIYISPFQKKQSNLGRKPVLSSLSESNQDWETPIIGRFNSKRKGSEHLQHETDSKLPIHGKSSAGLVGEISSRPRDLKSGDTFWEKPNQAGYHISRLAQVACNHADHNLQFKLLPFVARINTSSISAPTSQNLTRTKEGQTRDSSILGSHILKFRGAFMN